MALPPCLVFDVDGVLADVRHRLPHLQRRPKDWDGFFGAMAGDALLPEGADLVRAAVDEGNDVVYLTGRPEGYRATTTAWLAAHDLPAGDLVMRPSDDGRPARLFKPAALRRLRERYEVRMVIDDDAAVVRTLRSAGWPVLLADWAPDRPAAQQTLFEAQESDGRT